MHEYIVLHIPAEWKANARLFNFFLLVTICAHIPFVPLFLLCWLIIGIINHMTAYQI